MEKTLSNGDVVEISELTAGQIFDAIDATKSVHTGVTGTAFVLDQFKLERLLLLKALRKNGEEVSMNWLRSLKSQDHKILQDSVDEIDEAVLSEVGNRGRDSAAS